MNINLSVYIVSEWNRKYTLAKLLNSLVDNAVKHTYTITVIQNNVKYTETLEKWVQENTKCQTAQFITLEGKHGLSRIWNMCAMASVTEDMVFCGDYYEAQPSWDTIIEYVINKLGRKIYTLSENSHSLEVPFVIPQQMVYKYKYFNPAFGGTGHELLDMYLKIAYKEGKARTKDMKTHFMLLEDLLIEPPFKLQHNHEPEVTNQWIFNKYWNKSTEKKQGYIEAPTNPTTWYQPNFPTPVRSL